jgi:hypothetical protein
MGTMSWRAIALTLAPTIVTHVVLTRSMLEAPLVSRRGRTTLRYAFEMEQISVLSRSRYSYLTKTSLILGSTRRSTDESQATQVLAGTVDFGSILSGRGMATALYNHSNSESA